MEKIILFGTGQVAGASYVHFTHDTPHEVVGFTVDGEFLQEDRYLGLPVVAFEDLDRHFPPEDFKLHVSISYRWVNRLRAEKYGQAVSRGYHCVSYVSSKATIWPGVQVGDNCVIGSNTVIDPNVVIGDNVVVASGCVVGHNTVLGDHCFLGAGVMVSGSVVVEPYCFLGTGAVIRDRLRLAAASVVGAGAVILENTVEKGVYMGQPAKVLPVQSDRLPVE